MKKGIYLNDSIHGLISLTEYERRIVSTIGFNRLHDVYQNSTVYLTFPANRTKRFEHSVGTMKLCSDMFFQSLLNTTDSMLSEFFEIFDREYTTILDRLRKQMDVCEGKLGGRLPEAMPLIELDRLRHSLIPNNIPEQYKGMYLILIQSIRTAALLHDIGHPPFSHIVENGEIFFCVPLKAVSSVEDFVKRRYNSYKDIIYHHRVIQSDYILEGIVKDLVKKYLNENVSERQRDNEVLIPFDISGLWFPLGDKKSAIKANALSQWNDSWLMTVLRQIYYTEYYHNEEIEEGTGDFVLAQRLAELLRNSKRYHSLIKRSENFKIIDDAVKLEIMKRKKEIEAFLTKNNELSCSDRSTELIHQMLENTTKNSSGFVLSFISRYSKEMNIKDFESMVSEIVREETNNIITNLKTYDTVTLFKRISIGLDSPIYFYNHKGAISTLKDISGIADILQLDSDYLPVFYIYILAKDDDYVLKEKREELLGAIGKRISAKIMEIFLKE